MYVQQTIIEEVRGRAPVIKEQGEYRALERMPGYQVLVEKAKLLTYYSRDLTAVDERRLRE